MKIDNTGKPLSTPVIRSSDSRAVGRNESAEPQKKEPVPETSVKLESSFGLRLQQLEGSLVNQPVVDETRVAEIRQAISEGRFSVRADAIADKLMESVKELLGNKG